VTESRVSAKDLVAALVDRARAGLEDAGDLAEVERMTAQPTGAFLQRHAALKGLPAVVDMLIKQTTL
jgi:hypothetical protein